MSSKKTFNVAVLGATGAVGEIICNLLFQRKFPIDKLYPLSSERSAWDIVMFGTERIAAIDAAQFDWSLVDIAIFSAGAEVSKIYVPLATAQGCIVIDNSSAYRQDEDVPLIIPEINEGRIALFKNRNLIANPNCVTIQMLMALYPLYKEAGLKRIDICSYQSVSGTGRKAITELIGQVTNMLSGKDVEREVYPKQIAFNCLPLIGECSQYGFSDEETKIIQETHKIFEDDSILVNPTAVRVPTLYGHGEAVHIETIKPLSASLATQILSKAPGVSVIDSPENNQYPTVFTDAINHDEVFVGRIRNHPQTNNLLNLWLVSDNLRKGAALNSVQIAEILVDRYI
jgi:aspartate-semialdehyde dehydrogenase